MDGKTALQHAIMSVPVPGAPPRQTGSDRVGLSFLDAASTKLDKLCLVLLNTSEFLSID